METVAALIQRGDTQAGLAALEDDPAYQAIAAQAPSAATSLRRQFARPLAHERVAVLQRMPPTSHYPTGGNGPTSRRHTRPSPRAATHPPFAIAETIAARIPTPHCSKSHPSR